MFTHSSSLLKYNVHELIEAWLKSYDSLSSRTCSYYRSCLFLFLDNCFISGPFDLTLYHLLSWKDYCYFSYTKNVAYSKLCIVSSFYSFILSDLISFYGLSLSSLFSPPSFTRSFLVSSKLSDKDRAFISFLFHTGISFHQLASLTWDDFLLDSDYCFVYLLRSLKFDFGSDNTDLKACYYPIRDSLYLRLLHQRSPLRFCPWLFHDDDSQMSSFTLASWLSSLSGLSWISFYHSRNYYFFYDYFGIVTSLHSLINPEDNPLDNR